MSESKFSDLVEWGVVQSGTGSQDTGVLILSLWLWRGAGEKCRRVKWWGDTGLLGSPPNSGRECRLVGGRGLNSCVHGFRRQCCLI